MGCAIGIGHPSAMRSVIFQPKRLRTWDQVDLENFLLIGEPIKFLSSGVCS